MPVDVLTGLPVLAEVERVPVAIYAGLDAARACEGQGCVVGGARRADCRRSATPAA